MNVMEDENGNIDKAKTMAIRMNQSDQNRIEEKGMLQFMNCGISLFEIHVPGSKVMGK